MTVKELAAATGISERQLARYFERGCPRTSAAAILDWKSKHIRDTPEGSAGSIQEARLRLVQQQTAREAEQTQKLAIENAVRRGELIERAEVVRDISICLSRFRNRLEALPGQLCVLMPAEFKATAKQMAEGQVHTALKELADGLRSPPQ